MSKAADQQSSVAADTGRSESNMAPLDQKRVVRHIMVIGFHHKHGYQVDYCYPPLTPNGPTFTTPTKPITLPASWKTLPLLCLPDGSHNHDSDTIYFTMPDIEDHQQGAQDEVECNTTNRETNQQQGIKTIFGTACFRQINVEKLLHRTDDMTRIVVQKSVCVLSSEPLFGLIRSKLEMITHAYFEELDFSKVQILKLTYDNLNSLLSRQSVRDNATFLGLSTRHLVSQFGSNMLVLFKAMLLEKKILFYKSPVKDLCSTIMSMCSLFNGLLDCGGLNYSTCDLQLSPTLLEALKLEPKTTLDDDHEAVNRLREGKVFFSPAKEQVVIMDDDQNGCSSGGAAKEAIPSDGKDGILIDNEHNVTDSNDYTVISESEGETGTSSQGPEDKSHESNCDDEPNSILTEETIIEDQYAHKLCQMKPEDCGLPLQIFTRGSFCLPYLSISYLDLLSDSRVRSFVIGATNFLFKQRRDMYDVIVDMEEDTIVIGDAHLKQCLSLTIEDLRFMDYLSKNVNADTTGTTGSESAFDPINHDITKWLGGDEWIRYHFKIYTLYLLKAAKTSNNIDSFNANFVKAWKSNTNNYRIWDATGKATILNELQARHPFSSVTRRINFSDMKLKLSHAVNSSEKGRMVNQTLNEIGRWSIWNNIASAGNIAASTVSTLATSANLAMNPPADEEQPSSSATTATAPPPEDKFKRGH